MGIKTLKIAERSKNQLKKGLKGAGAGLHDNFAEIDFLVVLIEDTDIFQMLLVPSKILFLAEIIAT